MKVHKSLQKEAIAIHVKSVEHPFCPPVKKNVRAECIIGGYLLEKEIDSKGVEVTKLTMVSQNDIKGNLPKAMVNKSSTTAPIDWIKAL